MAMNYQCVKYHLPNGLELPYGCKFDPTDEDLVNSYLKLMVLNQPLPFCGIGQQFDVFQAEPWMLPYDRILSKHKKYYFFDTRKRRFENMDARAAGNGEWRMVEKNKEVVLPNSSFIGRKNTLEYWKIQGNEVVQTNWVMHEFRISKINNPATEIFLAAYRIFLTEAENENDFTIEDASSRTDSF